MTESNLKVWPEGFEETFCTNHWRCRFEVENGHPLEKQSIPNALTKALEEGIDVIKTENLYEFDGARAIPSDKDNKNFLIVRLFRKRLTDTGYLPSPDVQ